MIIKGFMAVGLRNILEAKHGEMPLVFAAFAIICIVVPYLLGSLNFAIIISKIRYGQDIRNYGSGNAGMTNMLRTYGKGAAVVTLLCDMLKAVVSAALGSALLGLTFGGYMAGFFCMLGRMFPIFYKFKGGKGVASTAAMILVLNPPVFVLLLFVFAVIVIGTKYVSLASIMSVLMFPVFLHRIDIIIEDVFYKKLGIMWGPDVLFAVAIAFMVVFMHRSNIKRLLEGTESKISLGGKKEKKGGEE